MTWKSSGDASVQAPGCAQAGMWGGPGRKTKPGTSHGAQGQARAPTGSFILDFNCPATPTPKFLMQMASRANTERKAMRQGWSVVPVPLPPQAGLSLGYPGLVDKSDQDVKPSRASRALFNRHEAFGVPHTPWSIPVSLLCARLPCPLPGGHFQGCPCHMHGEAGCGQALSRDRGTSMLAGPGF